MFEYRQYQSDLIKLTQEKMFEHGKVALCATCGAGKTVMATSIIVDYLDANPNARVLILTHGRTQLRGQFHSSLSERMEVTEYKSGDYPAAKVVVALPHIHSKEIPEIDLIVVDEAHHFLNAKMVQNILKKSKHKHLLALTGSAAYFVSNNFPRVMFSAQELRQVQPNALADVTTFVVQTAYDFKNSDYNKNDNLSEDIEIPKEETAKSLTMILWGLLNATQRNVGKKPSLFNGGDNVFQKVEHLIFKNNLEKTMIATTSIKQANDIFDILQSNNIYAVLSHSENDPDSSFIDEFYNNPAVKILIVVDRGILGFDMPSLKNIIDMTGSENPDTIFQLLGRVSRNDYSHIPKVFIRAAPKSRLKRSELVTCFALALSTQDVFETYDGKYTLTPFPVFKKPFIQRQKGEELNKKNKIKNENPEVIDLTDYSNILNHLKHKDDSPASAVSWVTLNKEFTVKWTKEACLNDALKFDSRRDWIKFSASAWGAARRNGWLDECCAHMVWKRISFEDCLKDAKSYSTRIDWDTHSSKYYRTAQYHGWLDECCAHMTVQHRKALTLPDCKASATPFNTRNEWRKACKSDYEAARRNGWLDECCAHMAPTSQQVAASITFEMCIEDAKNNSSKAIWKKESLIYYQAARRNGWFNACVAHMKNPRKK